MLFSNVHVPFLSRIQNEATSNNKEELIVIVSSRRRRPRLQQHGGRRRYPRNLTGHMTSKLTVGAVVLVLVCSSVEASVEAWRFAKADDGTLTMTRWSPPMVAPEIGTIPTCKIDRDMERITDKVEINRFKIAVTLALRTIILKNVYSMVMERWRRRM